MGTVSSDCSHWQALGTAVAERDREVASLREQLKDAEVRAGAPSSGGVWGALVSQDISVMGRHLYLAGGRAFASVGMHDIVLLAH